MFLRYASLSLMACTLAFSHISHATPNINQIDAVTLATLKGIGPAKARAIVEERDRNGPFIDASDLTRVKGIGQSLAEGLTQAVTFEQPAQTAPNT